ncbi:MAG: hypothetical protein PHV34_08440 [Verrucomicrobiae bacterium]|nr:hypothetical protein [Verrucomicrobiae bacterium]
MSTVEEIEQAIVKLPKKDFWKLAEWFEKHRNGVWDHEIEADAKPGEPLDKLAQQAVKEITSGKTIPLDEFLRNP